MNARLVTAKELESALLDIADSITRDDSFEGEIRYEVLPHQIVEDQEWRHLPDDAKELYDLVRTPPDTPLYRLREDVEVKGRFLITGMYRIGNSAGQGGVRTLGTF